MLDYGPKQHAREHCCIARPMCVMIGAVPKPEVNVRHLRVFFVLASTSRSGIVRGDCGERLVAVLRPLGSVAGLN
jgi:hypothetical protein